MNMCKFHLYVVLVTLNYGFLNIVANEQQQNSSWNRYGRWQVAVAIAATAAAASGWTSYPHDRLVHTALLVAGQVVGMAQPRAAATHSGQK